MNALRPTLRFAASNASRSSCFLRSSRLAAGSSRRFVHIENKLQELGIELPTAPTPKANYNIVCHVASGNMLYVSGHLPVQLDGSLITGRIGPKSGGESVEHGYAAARQCGLNILSTLKQQLGDLDRVEQVVKVCLCLCWLLLLLLLWRFTTKHICIYKCKRLL